MKSLGLLRKLCDVWHALQKVSFVLALGIAIIFLAAFTLHGPALIVAMVTGGILIIGGWVRSTFNKVVAGEVERQTNKSIVDELEQTRVRAEKLAQENKRLQNTKVRVLNVEPIMDLGLLEADCRITEPFDLLLDKNDEILSINDEHNPEYKKDESTLGKWGDGLWGIARKRFIGTLRMRFTDRYGIDIKQLTIKRDDISRRILVHGASVTYRGVQGFPESRWFGCVALKKKRNRSRVIAVFEPKTNVCRKMVEHWLILPPFLKQNRGFLTP
ncbi:MAG: hypothetical protein WC058_11830, partial [Phycisphaeraceae bacterium]